MSRLKNPIQQQREALDLSQAELAQKAGMLQETLVTIESGASLLLSRPLADKLVHIFPDATSEKLIEEYAAWRRLLEAQKEERS
ncbi:helix-turn-helix domain-containing protein [Candidatus Bipolaricaulota bacterium]|nr:helix-turn-helix domain-containing protein [Candidatus Bipolaricaulota bacterium]